MNFRTLTEKNKERLPWETAVLLICYIFLPEYFALEISAHLPLLTAGRAALILMGIMLLVYRRGTLLRNRKKCNLLLTDDRILRSGFFIYFILLLADHTVLLFTDAPEALKAILVLLTEAFFLVWILSLYLNTRARVTEALKILVLGTGITAAISIAGCILDMNFFHLLDTVKREMLMTTYYRLGMLRASAGFGHPVFYGAFCTVMVPLCMYLIDYTADMRERILYAACLSLNLTALVLSNSRGSMLAFLGMAAVICISYLIRKKGKQLLRWYAPVGAAALILLILVSVLSPIGISFLDGVADSLVSSVVPDGILPDSGLGSVHPPESAYGENTAGTASRLRQLSGIRWTLERRPLFGFGSNAHVRGLICFRLNGRDWWTSRTFDMAIVAIICQYGLVGLCGYAALYGAVGWTIGKYRKDPLMQYLGLAFCGYLLCLLSVSSLENVAWVLMALILCTANCIGRES